MQVHDVHVHQTIELIFICLYNILELIHSGKEELKYKHCYFFWQIEVKYELFAALGDIMMP